MLSVGSVNYAKGMTMRAVEQVFQTRYWRMQIPEGWTPHIHSPEMVTVYSPNGVGMLEFFHSQEPYDGTGPDSEIFGGFHGRHAGEKTHRGILRRFWHLSCMGRKLSVRYNCSEENAELDRAQVDAALQTLEPAGDPG